MSVVEEAAEVLRQADHLLIGAGAGMGVDSGLPDFRGNEGFWKAYPPYRKLGLGFMEMASPRGFDQDPSFAWGFYGHRLNLYRKVVPHAGFGLLLDLAQVKRSAFVMTSNVDGQFQRAGFDPEQVYEIHGSIHHLQCSQVCHGRIWSANEVLIEVDHSTMRAQEPLPYCEACGAAVRPNILMFGDFYFLEDRVETQHRRFQRWTSNLTGNLAIVEIGAGVHIPSIRMACEELARSSSATLIRINPRDSEGPAGTLSIDMGGLEGLQLLLKGSVV